MFTVVSLFGVGVHIVVDVGCSPLGCDNVFFDSLLRLENHLKFLVEKCHLSVPDHLVQVIGCVFFVVV